jgi:hypothetical protein
VGDDVSRRSSDFPRALARVGVTSRSWPAPSHIQLSYLTNPFGWRPQVHRSLSTYGAAAQLRVTAIFGGIGMGAQIQL